jgi:hypothetical protein
VFPSQSDLFRTKTDEVFPKFEQQSKRISSLAPQAVSL